MKIISFNVNGVRAITKKSFLEDMQELSPDVICLQETKATVEQTKEAIAPLKNYQVFGNQAEKKGYSGTAILTKQQPISTSVDIGVAEHDKEGRVTCVELEHFYVLSVYVPNSGNALARLDYRQTWDKALLTYIKELEKKKPVIACGDFNVAHTEIDLARPKANYDKHAGFTQKEIDGMDAYTSNGLVDSFRKFHPDEVKYSWWSYRGGARSRNVGWRIDYVLVSESYAPNLKDAFILNDVMGSDHCPVGIEI